MNVYTYRFMYRDHDSNECYVSIGARCKVDALKAITQHNKYYNVQTKMVATSNPTLAELMGWDALPY